MTHTLPIIVFLACLLLTGCKARQSATTAPASPAARLTPEEREALKAELLQEIKNERQREIEEKEKGKVPITDRLPYTLDSKGTAFKFANFNMGYLYYTLDSQPPNLNQMQPLFFYQFIYNREQLPDTLDLLQSQLKSNYPGTDIDRNSLRHIAHQDTLKGLEVQGKLQREGRTHGIYSAVLMGTGYYLRFFGVSPDDPEKYMNDFRTLRHNFRFRTPPSDGK